MPRGRLSRGLPKTLPSMATTVSAATTTSSEAASAETSRAFCRANSSTSWAGVSSGWGSSSPLAGRTVKENPICPSSSRLRGDWDASIIAMLSPRSSHAPVEPKPPAPRAVSSSSSTSSTWAWITGAIISWAMRSAGWMT